MTLVLLIKLTHAHAHSVEELIAGEIPFNFLKIVVTGH